jgi:RecA-family ATPase
MGLLYETIAGSGDRTAEVDAELPPKLATPDRFDAAELMSMRFDPIKFVVPGYCAEGLTILAGRPKLGKSRLALDWLVAISAGGVAMSTVSVEQGDCLYLALEDSPRRLKSRIVELTGDLRDAEHLERLSIWTKAPRLDQKLTAQFDAWAERARTPRLIVIDVFARVRPDGRANENAYDGDYRALIPLQEWATRTGIAALLIHHTRKAVADDPLEMLSGTNGLAGAADTVLVLNRDANGTTLYVRGRDIEESEAALQFERGRWHLAGDAAEIRKSGERREILAALEDAAGPLGPKEIASITGMKAGNVRALLLKLGKAGDIAKAKYGKYVVAQAVQKPDNTDHTDNTSKPRSADDEA